MNAIESNYDVIIVGAGPCGVTAANLLGQQGIKTLVIDKEADILTIPRAIGICEEGSRVMQAADVLPDISEDIRAIDKVIFADKHQQSVFHLDIDPDRNGFYELRTFFQPDLEKTIRNSLNRYPEVSMQVSTKLLDFHDKGDSISVALAQNGQTYTTQCRYLLACDGAKSSIRKKLNIGFSGSTYPQDWMILDIKNNPVPSNTVVFSIDPSRPSVTLPGPGDKRRWEFVVKKGEDPETLFCIDNLRKMLRTWGNVDDMTIERKAVYTFHARNAKRFRKGNVFLLGDAAHITPPFAGQGMMAGLRDVSNLCWKLGAVINARAHARLLDSYEKERLPQSQQIISVAQFLGSIILPQNRMVARARNLLINVLGKLGVHSPQRGVPIQKIANHINGGLLRHILISALRSTGSEFPQYRLTCNNGEKKLFDDFVESQFLLLSWGNSTQQLLNINLRQRWSALGGKYVSINANAEEAEDSICLNDTAQSYRDYFKGGERVVVVRPDKMVVINCKLSKLNKELDRYLNQLGAPQYSYSGAS